MVHRRQIGTILLLQVSTACLYSFSGCELPRDPEATLDRVRGGTLRAGITEDSPLVVIRGGKPAGFEVELVRQIADSLDADIEWFFDSEGDLLRLLENSELDVVIGGIRDDTPWRDRVALTRAYDDDTLTAGDSRPAHVIALPPGENAWLLHVDRWLQEHRSGIANSIERLP